CLCSRKNKSGFGWRTVLVRDQGRQAERHAFLGNTTETAALADHHLHQNALGREGSSGRRPGTCEGGRTRFVESSRPACPVYRLPVREAGTGPQNHSKRSSGSVCDQIGGQWP